LSNAEGNILWQDNSTKEYFNFIANNFGLGIHEIAVTVTNQDNCSSSDQVYVEVKEPSGIDPELLRKPLMVYPNPTSGHLILEFMVSLDSPVSMHLFDMSGKNIYNREIEISNKGDQFEIDLSGEARGLYLLIIRNKTIEWNYTIIYK